MKLYRISQEANTGYDTYDSAIVAAVSEIDAATINPSYSKEIPENGKWKNDWQKTWCPSILDVVVEYIGEAKDGTERGLILCSFNAG